MEIGSTVEVRITNAAPNGVVTVIQNGNPPYEFGFTDTNGQWSISAVEQQGNVGSYEQRWFVNGNPVTPANLTLSLFPWAPQLPVFQVYGSTPPLDVPRNQDAVNVCGQPGSPTKWAWTPVRYLELGVPLASTLNQAITNAIGKWNVAQTKVALQSDQNQLDIVFVNDGGFSPNALAVTAIFTPSCGTDQGSCFRRTLSCGNICFTNDYVLYADIYINSGIMELNIADVATGLGVTTDLVRSLVLAHELGHTMMPGHSRPSLGTCSEGPALMNFGIDGLALFISCGGTTLGQADVARFNALNPVSPPLCLGGARCFTGASCQ